MPVPSQADGNVKLIPGRPKYNIVTDRNAVWVYQRMGTGKTFGGTKPMLAATPVADVADPSSVTAGRAEWTNLETGGLFTLVGLQKKALICDAIDNAAGATLTLVTASGALSRSMPGTLPFTIAPGEYIKASGGSSGGSVGFLLTTSEKAIL